MKFSLVMALALAATLATVGCRTTNKRNARSGGTGGGSSVSDGPLPQDAGDVGRVRNAFDTFSY